MPYNSAMTAVLKCNNCAKSGREASSIMMYLARYAAKRGLEARSAEVIFEFQSRGGLHSHSLAWLVHESNAQVQP